MPIEVETPDGGIAEFPDGTSPDVIKSALRKKFGGPPAAAPAAPTAAPAEVSDVDVSRAFLDQLTGAGKALGRTAVGALRMTPPMLAERGLAAVTGRESESDARLQEIFKALAAEGENEQVGGTVAELGSYAVPGALGVRAPGILGAAAQGAIEGGLIGSAQKGGEADFGAAAGGGVGGLVGGTVAKVVGGLAKKAPELWARMLRNVGAAPKGQHAEETMQAIREVLSDPAGPPAGNLEEVADAVRARLARLRVDKDAVLASEAGRRTSLKPLANDLTADAMAATEKGDKGAFIRDPRRFEQANERTREIVGLMREYKGGEVPRGVLEKRLSELDDLVGYHKANPGGAPGTDLDYMKSVADRLRALLNETSYVRPDVTRPFSRALTLSEGLDTALGRAPFRATSEAGETGAARGVAAAMLGAGNAPGAAAAAVTPKLLKYFSSPQYLTKNAATRLFLARQLSALTEPELAVALRALGAETSDQDQ